jgi:hypothetical protein
MNLIFLKTLSWSNIDCQDATQMSILSVPDDGYFVVYTKFDIYVFIIIARSIPLLVD